jgi:hypothetical protein
LFLEVAFAVEPILHGDGEAIEGDAVADFEEAVGDGESVVEDGVVGEVAHGKAVEPLDGAGRGRGDAGEIVDCDFALKHGYTNWMNMGVSSAKELGVSVMRAVVGSWGKTVMVEEP